VKAVDVNTATELSLIGALAVIWLGAGLLADSLPVARTALDLRRRVRLVSLLIGAGAAVFVAVAALPVESAVKTAAVLPAVPGMVVLVWTWRRLTQVRQGAGAFATAPGAPLPPALRAAAAHPLIAAPLQVTGLAALIGLPIAGGVVTVPGDHLAGPVITGMAVAVIVIAVRHAVRHSRLSLYAIAPLTRRSRDLTGV
jgi:hypothetical protein